MRKTCESFCDGSKRFPKYFREFGTNKVNGQLHVDIAENIDLRLFYSLIWQPRLGTGTDFLYWYRFCTGFICTGTGTGTETGTGFVPVFLYCTKTCKMHLKSPKLPVCLVIRSNMCSLELIITRS